MAKTVTVAEPVTDRTLHPPPKKKNLITALILHFFSLALGF